MGLGEHTMTCHGDLHTRETPSQAFSGSFVEIGHPKREEKQDGVLIMIGAVAVPRGGINQAPRGPFDDLHSISDVPILRQILIDGELGQGEGNQHALNGRHAEK